MLIIFIVKQYSKFNNLPSIKYGWQKMLFKIIYTFIHNYIVN